MKHKAFTSFVNHVVNQMILLGVGFILLAILFVIWPEFLIYLISAFFILFGILSIFYALKIRKIKKDMEEVMKKLIP